MVFGGSWLGAHLADLATHNGGQPDHDVSLVGGIGSAAMIGGGIGQLFMPSTGQSMQTVGRLAYVFGDGKLTSDEHEVLVTGALDELGFRGGKYLLQKMGMSPYWAGMGGHLASFILTKYGDNLVESMGALGVGGGALLGSAAGERVMKRAGYESLKESLAEKGIAVAGMDPTQILDEKANAITQEKANVYAIYKAAKGEMSMMDAKDEFNSMSIEEQDKEYRQAWRGRKQLPEFQRETLEKANQKVRTAGDPFDKQLKQYEKAAEKQLRKYEKAFIEPVVDKEAEVYAEYQKRAMGMDRSDARDHYKTLSREDQMAQYGQAANRDNWRGADSGLRVMESLTKQAENAHFKLEQQNQSLSQSSMGRSQGSTNYQTAGMMGGTAAGATLVQTYTEKAPDREGISYGQSNASVDVMANRLGGKGQKILDARHSRVVHSQSEVYGIYQAEKQGLGYEDRKGFEEQFKNMSAQQQQATYEQVSNPNNWSGLGAEAKNLMENSVRRTNNIAQHYDRQIEKAHGHLQKDRVTHEARLVADYKEARYGGDNVDHFSDYKNSPSEADFLEASNPDNWKGLGSTQTSLLENRLERAEQARAACGMGAAGGSAMANEVLAGFNKTADEIMKDADMTQLPNADITVAQQEFEQKVISITGAPLDVRLFANLEEANPTIYPGAQQGVLSKNERLLMEQQHANAQGGTDINSAVIALQDAIQSVGGDLGFMHVVKDVMGPATGIGGGNSGQGMAMNN